MGIKRLSGWARLWIVLLAPIWLISVAVNIGQENSNWPYVCDWKGCAGYVETPPAPQRDDDQGTSTYRLERAADLRAELTRRASLTANHQQKLVTGLVGPTIGVLIAFVVAMLIKVAALWVWRGFRPPSEAASRSQDLR